MNNLNIPLYEKVGFNIYTMFDMKYPQCLGTISNVLQNGKKDEKNQPYGYQNLKSIINRKWKVSQMKLFQCGKYITNIFTFNNKYCNIVKYMCLKC